MRKLNVLVVGASSGLGRSVAALYAKRGANVIITSRSEEALLSLQSEIQSSGGSCSVHPCDIRSSAHVKQLVADVLAQHRYIDIAILGSAVQYIDRVDQLNYDELEAMFQTNVIGIITLTRHLLPHMLTRQAGQLVFISSIMGEAAFPHMVPYGATKAAISSFAKGLQRELSSSNINVTLVSPGHMNTNLSAHLQNRIPHWYGQSGSLEIDKVARRMIDAIENKRTHIIIGRQSKLLSLLNRLFPNVANSIIRKITT